MNSRELTQEFRRRAGSVGLKVDVFGDGNTTARIAIIAEAPGPREVELRTPMVGETGKYLWNALRRIGVARSDCYITNVVKKQLVINSQERAVVSQGELDHYSNLLRWELSCLPNIQYILLLGDAALNAVVGVNGIEKWRGSCLQDSDGRWNIITHNPAYILRVPALESVFAQDVYKMKMIMEDRFVVPVIKPILNPTPSEAIRWMDKMQDEKLPISIDIETHSHETACIGLANSTETGMCINFRDRTDNRWSAQEERDVRLRFAKLGNDTTVRFVAQNGPFDVGWLWYKDRLRVHSIWFDTMLAHHTLYPGLPHDLGFLTAQYTNHPYYKDEREVWREGGDIDRYWEYNVKDCCITLMVANALKQELLDQSLFPFFMSHVMHLQPHLIEMTANGVSVDLTMKEKLKDVIGADVERLRQEFQRAVCAATGDQLSEVNPGSPKQLSELFFNKLRLVSRGNSVAKAARVKMLSHPGTSDASKEVILALNRYAEDKKFHSTYASTKLDEDGRIRCEYKQTGTQSAPGRLSSAKTLWDTGMNMQNQPPKARPMYVAPPGYEYFYFDLAQAEARVVAYEANIPVWKEQFERARLDGSFDSHRALASEMFKTPYDQVPTYDFDDTNSATIRYIAKRCRHGLNYRMAHERLAEVTKLPIIEALRIWMIYHRTTPELQVWWRELEEEARTKKMMFSAYGRRLVFMGPITEDSLESIVAFKPQSLVGDHTASIIYKAHEDERWPDHSRILINVHDSLTGIAPVGKGIDCLRVCKYHAEQPITIRGEPLIIPADCALSIPDGDGIHRWSNLKKLKL